MLGTLGQACHPIEEKVPKLNTYGLGEFRLIFAYISPFYSTLALVRLRRQASHLLVHVVSLSCEWSVLTIG
jgi:hypothetical protein